MDIKTSHKPLKSNPFQSIRDPKTGRWIIVKSCEQQIKKKEKAAWDIYHFHLTFIIYFLKLMNQSKRVVLK